MAFPYSESDIKARLEKSTLNYSFKIVENSVVFASQYSGRAERRSELQAISALFPDFNFVIKSDGKFLLEKRDGSRAYKMLMKPSRTAAGIILKPQFFPELLDKDIPLNSYPALLLSSIKNSGKLSDDQKLLLNSLVHAVDSNDYSNFSNTFLALKDSIPINTINNDFSELLGPIAIARKQMLPISSSKSKVMFPGRGNEPLLDYKITSDNTVYKISAKSGDSTNTLKPGDVLQLIDAETKLKSKYSNTLQYKVLKLLKNNTWKQGPIEALNLLKSARIPDAMWLKSKQYTEQIRQMAENSLVKISRETLDFTELFRDATNLKVYYVKFKLGQDGMVKWDMIRDDKNRQSGVKKIVFRSKNFVGRSNGDKLGFQPK